MKRIAVGLFALIAASSLSAQAQINWDSLGT